MPDTKLKGNSTDLLRIVLPAAARGDLKTIKRFIRSDVRWLYRIGPHGRTMLWEAAYKNRFDAVRFLIQHGADVNALGTYYTPLIVDLSPFAVARRAGNEPLMNLLADSGALMDLHSAAYFGETEQVNSFLDDHPEAVNQEADIFSGRPLVVADVPMNKKLAAAVARIERQINDVFDEATTAVDQQLKSKKVRNGDKNLLVRGYGTPVGAILPEFGDLIQDIVSGKHTSRNRHATIRELHRRWSQYRQRWFRQFDYYQPPAYIHTSLHYAVLGGHLDIVQFLIQRGADVQPYGASLLELGLDSPSMIKLLIDNGANIKSVANASWVGDKHLESIAKRHNAEVDINKLADGKFTVLIDACRGNHNAPDKPSRVQAILDRGADINARDYKGKTALHRAAQAGFQKIGTLLCDSGADLEARDDQSETPIFDAVRHGRLATTKLLVKRGAEVSVSNKTGRTLLEIAGRSKKKDANRVLRCIRSALR